MVKDGEIKKLKLHIKKRHLTIIIPEEEEEDENEKEADPSPEERKEVFKEQWERSPTEEEVYADEESPQSS